MARRLRYIQDKPGRLTPYPESKGKQPFSAFAVSPRIQKLTLRIGRDVKAIAKAISPEGEEERDKVRYRDAFIVVPGKPLKIEGLWRSTALVGNTAPHAPAVEFGSGEPSVGDTQNETRPQGGYNYSYRVLGRAGSRVGDFHG